MLRQTWKRRPTREFTKKGVLPVNSECSPWQKQGELTKSVLFAKMGGGVAVSSPCFLQEKHFELTETPLFREPALKRVICILAVQCETAPQYRAMPSDMVSLRGIASIFLSFIIWYRASIAETPLFKLCRGYRTSSSHASGKVLRTLSSHWDTRKPTSQDMGVSLR